MTPFWLGVFVGLVFGATLGTLIVALCVAASRADAHFDDTDWDPRC